MRSAQAVMHSNRRGQTTQPSCSRTTSPAIPRICSGRSTLTASRPAPVASNPSAIRHASPVITKPQKLKAVYNATNIMHTNGWKNHSDKTVSLEVWQSVSPGFDQRITRPLRGVIDLVLWRHGIFRGDINRDAHFMFAASDDRTLNRTDVIVITAPGHGNMIG